MKTTNEVPFMAQFSILTDPRVERTRKHHLIDVLVIAVCAVISGAESWYDLEVYGEAKEKWLKTFLELPHGIPTHDTFARVFAAIDGEEFERLFFEWTHHLHQVSQGRLIAIDGKTLRRSFDTATKKSAIHLVSAWAVENEVLLGQIKVDEKSNEITAVPKLLNMLMLKGALITLDAMGCQKENTKVIYKKGGDYVISLKGNQSTLHQEVKDFFNEQLRQADPTIKIDTFESTEKGHGRIEIRKYHQTESLEWISAQEGWAGLKSIGCVTSTRIIGEKTSVETRYFISSLELDAKRFGAAVRGHWAVENKLHWCLDVQMNEDQCRKRAKNAAQNFALLRRIALNLLKAEKTRKGSMKGRSKLTGWDHDYLLKVLLGPSPLATA